MWIAMTTRRGTGNEPHRLTAAMVVLLVLSGCRAFEVDGETLAERNVLGRTLLTSEEVSARTYVSTRESLGPLAGALDRGVGADVNVLDMTFTPRPNGTVTFLDTTTATGELVTGPFTSDGAPPFRPIELGPLRAEVANFFATLITPLAALPGVGALPVAPVIPNPGVGGVGDFMSRTTLRVAGSRGLNGGIELSWDVPGAVDADPTAPVLVIRIVFDVDEELQGWLRPLLVADITHLALRMRVQPRLCSLAMGAANPCSHGGSIGGFFAGYTGPGDIAAAPDVNIELAFAGETESEAIVTILPTCYLTPLPGIGPCEGFQTAMLVLIDEIESSLLGLSRSVAAAAALEPGLPPLAFPRAGVDVGLASVTVDPMGTSGFPTFTAPFGATGGLWGDTAIMGLTRDMTVSVPVSGGSFSRTLGMPSPNWARLVDFSPYFSGELRRVFAEPVLREVDRRAVVRADGTLGPTRATFTRVAPVAATSTAATGASFSWIFDADADGIDDDVDSCPDVADTLTTGGTVPDVDRDGLADVCDSCPGVASLGRLDRDRDGLSAPCDCNIDGDMCPERAFDATSARGSDCSVPPGATFDRDPRGTPAVDSDGDGVGDTTDTDGDGIPNDCDVDSDADTIADEVDNCPLVPNNDQLDSGGSRAGNACDPLCPVAGAHGCRFSEDFVPRLSRMYEGASAFAACLGGRCEQWARIDVGCLADGSKCFDLTAVDLATRAGALTSRLGPEELTVDQTSASTLARINDLDGDGVEDIAVGLPRASICPAGEPCQQAGGRVVLVSSATGQVLTSIDGPHAGANFGWSLATVGGTLFIGAPAASRASGPATGAVYAYDVRVVGAAARTAAWYGAAGSRYGSALLTIDHDRNGSTELVIAASGASTQWGSTAGRVELRTLAGAVLRRFDSTVAGAAMADSPSALVAIAGVGLAASSPRAGAGRGRVWFFDWSGTLRWSATGGVDEQLGASLAAFDIDRNGSVDVAVGAPGVAKSRGAVRVYATQGGALLRSLSGNVGLYFGMQLSTPGDVDRNGRAELWVSGMGLGRRAASTLVIEPN